MVPAAPPAPVADTQTFDRHTSGPLHVLLGWRAQRSFPIVQDAPSFELLQARAPASTHPRANAANRSEVPTFTRELSS